MKEERNLTKKRKNSLSNSMKLLQVGFHKCESGHAYGPAVRDYYLCHYIYSGSGKVYYKDQEITLNHGSIFMIEPGEITTYQADTSNPWTYYWFAYDGGDSKFYTEMLGFGRIKHTRNIGPAKELVSEFQRLIGLKLKEESDKIMELCSLYRILYLLRKDYELSADYELVEDYGSPHIRMAIDYMNKNYTRELTVQNVADYVDIDRTQLYRLFMQEQEISPKAYLMKIRMEKAKYLLTSTELSIKSIACSVGYTDPYVFSKAFKNYFGSAPIFFLEALNNS